MSETKKLKKTKSFLSALEVHPRLIFLFFFILFGALYFLRPYLRPPDHNLTAGEQTYLQNRGEIVVAISPDHPPFSFSPDGMSNKGYLVDLLRLIAFQLDVEIRFVQVPLGEAVDKLSAGEADILTGLQATPKRQEILLFGTPFMPVSQALVVPASIVAAQDKDFDPISFINNQIIAGIDTPVLKSRIEEKGGQHVPVATPTDALTLLRQRTVGGWWVNHQVALYFLRQYRLGETLAAAPLPGTAAELSFAFAKDDYLLAKTFDKALYSLVAANQLTLLDQRWFGTGFYRQKKQHPLLYSFLAWGLLTLLVTGMVIFPWNFALVRKIKKTSSLLEEEKEALLVQLRGAAIAFGGAIKEKDSYTGEHSERVAFYALRLGEKMGLSKEDLFQLELAALLHDVGKIGIPDHLLTKTGLYTARELKLMQEHPTKGAAILLPLSPFSQIIESTLYHHERWDGCPKSKPAGYPGQKKGEDIPLFARIISLANAFDAMTAKRAMRISLSEQEALAEIKRGRETQFDPHLADLFCQAILKEGAG